MGSRRRKRKEIPETKVRLFLSPPPSLPKNMCAWGQGEKESRMGGTKWVLQLFFFF